MDRHCRGGDHHRGNGVRDLSIVAAATIEPGRSADGGGQHRRSTHGGVGCETHPVGTTVAGIGTIYTVPPVRDGSFAIPSTTVWGTTTRGATECG